MSQGWFGNNLSLRIEIGKRSVKVDRLERGLKGCTLIVDAKWRRHLSEYSLSCRPLDGEQVVILAKAALDLLLYHHKGRVLPEF